MAMVNMNNLLNGKDSRWLQLEVCREFQRQKCSRPDTECKFAHPPANVEVQNGRVTACYDSIKGRCNREKPPCKYFHPPQHLKDQLLINGRNHLALKNALMQQMGLTPGQPLVPGQVPAVATNPYLSMPQVGSTYNPYFPPGPLMPAIMGPDPTGVASPLGVVPQTVVAAQQKMPRSDRLEMDMKSVGSFYYENFAFPSSMVPYKRPAADKSGVPVYQPGATTYQQLMQLQQPFVPVSCEYASPPPSLPPAAGSPGVEAQAATARDPGESEQPLPSAAPPVSLPDAAAIAKEVAQQNYAKKVAAAAAAAGALSYTGVALSKQAPRLPTHLPLTVAAPAFMPLRAPSIALATAAAATPYQLLRQHQTLPLWGGAAPLFGPPLYPPTAAATQHSHSHAAAAQAAAAAAAHAAAAHAAAAHAAAAHQNNNNNGAGTVQHNNANGGGVVMQPFKKMKTT